MVVSAAPTAATIRNGATCAGRTPDRTKPINDAAMSAVPSIAIECVGTGGVFQHADHMPFDGVHRTVRVRGAADTYERPAECEAISGEIGFLHQES